MTRIAALGLAEEKNILPSFYYESEEPNSRRKKPPFRFRNDFFLPVGPSSSSFFGSGLLNPLVIADLVSSTDAFGPRGLLVISLLSL
eukprot:CAMPEP_0172533766 /NCGR_PEP_ID=MMETSP1067-20121228/6358_1 /TAXON_ID=265564 ORGANISM="Thalassiosira punctigera, Strain Tpunct2005C2" /NCGR_SAMPLE_ID=MMETSP1067 /ASSEMBLY_ACC=CAM_ASM_000444 /LENGTH=86 /DNA_ID=CAMNT_0013318453 /DNA_START=41 /DNA_END=302 /DNA_ORIENTATION=-